MVERVLVPVDGSEHARESARFVADQFPDATVVLLHVVDPAAAGYTARASIPSYSEAWFEQERERASQLFDTVAAELGDQPIERMVEVGKPADTIVDVAIEEPVDHVVMGSHGRSGVSRILLGSVAEAVVRRAPVPVTVTR